MGKGLLPVLCLCIFLPALAALEDRGILPGDERAAEQYLILAESALAVGRRAEALAVLERGGDFSGESSDISYLLARLRFEEGKPAAAALEALRRAREAGRWGRYTPEEAGLLEAEIFIRLCSYEKALEILAGLPRSAPGMRLQLLACRRLSDPGEFLRIMGEALERFPRESWPLRILFAYGEDRLPSGAEGDLMALALRRLPFLLEADPDLAWLAFPFIRDLDEALRLVAAYRAAGGGDPASLPAVLSLGLAGEAAAVEELFQVPPGGAESRLDKALILRLGRLLLDDTARELFKRNLLEFSGLITEDIDGDGYPEARVRYREGRITEYVCDPDQDGLPELTVSFRGGLPFRAELAALPEVFAGGEPGPFVYPRRDEDRLKALIRWEQYPAVLESALEGSRYIPRPGDFFYAPFQLQDLGGTGLLFPAGDPRRFRLSRRTLLSFAALLERPSREFAGALERIELNRGIPETAREFLDGRLVSETEFSRGRPLLQRIDLDLDGRLETVRRFRRTGGAEPFPSYLPDYLRDLESSESDWDGDGIFETGERYVFDESGEALIRSWDMDGDGVRELEK